MSDVNRPWDHARQLEITYLGPDGQPTNRSRAVAVRRRVLDLQGRVLQERIRHTLSHSRAASDRRS